MERESKFFTQIHRELLKLVEYHKHIIAQNHKAGKIDTEDDQRLLILKDIPRIIDMNITNKENYENTKREEKKKLLALREQADCPDCKKDVRVKIVKQTTNKKYGWKLDVVKCRECKKVFVNYMPNNWPDRLKFMENMITKLHEVNHDDKTLAEQLDVNGLITQKDIDDFNAFKITQLTVEQAEIEQMEAIRKADKSLVDMYNFLLEAKLKGIIRNMPSGIN